MKNQEIQTSSPVIGEEQIRLLEQLSNACAVSGDEGEIRKIVIEQIKPYVDEYKIDALGNILAVRKAKTQNPIRVMLDAHMDEVGFMLVNNEGNGLYEFKTVGGIDPRKLVGKPVWVGKDHLPGIIGARPVHLTKPSERKNAIPLEGLRIDIGPENGNKAVRGDRAAYATKFMRFGPSIRGKALDDRLGVAMIIEMIKHAPPNIELLAAFTVQEEIGLRGAKGAAYALNPDLAIALDSTPSNDMPVWDQSENFRYNTLLGKGPALYPADRSTLSDPRLIEYFVKTARAHDIPCQFRQAGGGSTDAGSIHRTKTGIPSISMSVPGRYAHTSMMVSRLEDWQNTLKLLHTALCELTVDVLEQER